LVGGFKASLRLSQQLEYNNNTGICAAGLAGNEQARQACFENNRKFYAEVKKRGLL
jgi:hypothetical protein